MFKELVIRKVLATSGLRSYSHVVKVQIDLSQAQEKQ